MLRRVATDENVVIEGKGKPEFLFAAAMLRPGKVSAKGASFLICMIFTLEI